MIPVEEAALKLKDLNQAVEIEKTHRYVDVKGRKKHFSSFVVDTLTELSRLDLTENPDLEKLIRRFRNYRFMDVGSRMDMLGDLETALKEGQLRHVDSGGFQKVRRKVVTAGEDKPLHEIDVQYVRGVGPKFAKVLNLVDVYTVEDLLYYFPRRYLDFNNRLKIAELREGDEVTVIGTLRSVNAYNAKRRNICIVTITVTDGSGTATASWFYKKANRPQLESYKNRFARGSEVMLSGRVKWDKFKRVYAIDKAHVEVLSYQADGEESSLHAGRIVPVYPLTEGLNLRSLRRAIHNALEDYLEHVQEPLPTELRKNNRLIDLQKALRQIHFPDTKEEYAAARERLVFDELFYMQVRLALMRQQYKATATGLVIHKREGRLVDRFMQTLPFELTNAQKRCLTEIYGDLASPLPMYRLLQGDVGSGKTVVALATMLLAVENGYQAAMMAPTEILAEQHYRKFVEWLTPLGLKVGLFVGKAGAKERRQLRADLLNGQIHVAVGTHALIQDDVEFQKLGVVVIDEQHRFGVRQRTLLKDKAEHPEMLTMTATPIPRTLAMTVHGDLDVSILDERPPGRTPIKTVLLTSRRQKEGYQLIRQEILKGRQAYVVFPLIEESETLSARAATSEAERLRQEVFPDLRVGLLHGKMKPEGKEKVMHDFLAKKLDILVSTTVIEVGVDVPNATVMVIENADRFGLAQLHQLRGRVGRDAHQSYCVLVSDSHGDDTMTRLGILAGTEDGFKIAESDLEIRGPGEFLGTRQSGLPGFALADLVEDRELLEQARKAAFAIVDDPDYLKNHPDLEKIIYQKTEETFSVLGSG